MTDDDMKGTRRFWKGCLYLFLGYCCYIAYGLWEPFLEDVYYPMPLAEGSQFEFEYTPEWAILRRQTLVLCVEASDFRKPPYGIGTVKLKLEIYQSGEKQYENVFLYHGGSGQFSAKPKGVQKPISVIDSIGKSELKKPDAYGTSFFKFQPHKTYRIVVTTLAVENSKLLQSSTFVGLARAAAFRTVRFSDFRF